MASMQERGTILIFILFDFKFYILDSVLVLLADTPDDLDYG